MTLCLISSETKDVISTMVQSFKESNPSWTKTSVVITDKDFVERSVFDEEFPRAVMHIMPFPCLEKHVQRSFL